MQLHSHTESINERTTAEKSKMKDAQLNKHLSQLLGNGCVKTKIRLQPGSK